MWLFSCRSLATPKSSSLTGGGSVGVEQEDVRGLHVAVDDALLVCGAQSVEGPEQNLGGVEGREGALAVQPAQEALPLEILKDEVVAVVRVESVVVEGDDVGVLESADRLGLAQEASDEVVVLGVLGAQHLDGGARAVRALAEVDRAHSAGAEGLREPVARDLYRGARYGWERCRRSVGRFREEEARFRVARGALARIWREFDFAEDAKLIHPGTPATEVG